MAKTSKGEFVQPKEPASGDYNGAPFVLRVGEVFAADHPLVREYPHLFKPLEAARQRPAAEQVTAAPGERRGDLTAA